MAGPLAGFAGFGVDYSAASNPYFEMIMIESLTLIQSVALGKELLDLIRDAKPASRADFPNGVNVMCKPYPMKYVQSGFKLAYSPGSANLDTLAPSSHAAHNIKDCPFHGYGSSRNMAVDQLQTSKGGTVCYMEYANTQVLASGGTITWPHIVLAHELIHSYHCLYGIHADAKEKPQTSGIGEYANEHMSENGFRKAFKLPPRLTYG